MQGYYLTFRSSIKDYMAYRFRSDTHHITFKRLTDDTLTHLREFYVYQRFKTDDTLTHLRECYVYQRSNETTGKVRVTSKHTRHITFKTLI